MLARFFIAILFGMVFEVRLQTGVDLLNTVTAYRLNQSVPSAFTVWKDDNVSPTLYRAESNLEGVDDVSGTNAATVMSTALATLTPARTWQEKVVLNGDFITTTPILINPYTILELQGMVTLGNNANCSIVQNTNWLGPWTDKEITVCGGIWDGNKANNTASYGGISLRAGPDANFQIFNTHIKNVNGYGGIYAASWGSKFYANTIENVTWTGAPSYVGAGIYETAGGNNVITNNLLIGNKLGIVLEDNEIYGNITDNIIKQAIQYGIFVAYCTKVNVAHNSIYDMATAGGFTGLNGIAFGGSDITIDNNIISDIPVTGIGGSGSNNSITNNKVKNCGKESAGHGIDLSSFIDHILVASNRCYDDQTPKTQDYGIIDGNVTHEYIRIIDNDVVGNQLGGMLFVGAWGAGRVLKGNAGYITENSGSGTGSGAEQTIAHGLEGDLIPNNVTVVPTEGGTTVSSVWADATNIYCTVTNGKLYRWGASVTKF